MQQEMRFCDSGRWDAFSKQMKRQTLSCVRCGRAMWLGDITRFLMSGAISVQCTSIECTWCCVTTPLLTWSQWVELGLWKQEVAGIQRI